MEETTLQNTRSQVVRMSRGDLPAFPPTEHHPDERERDQQGPYGDLQGDSQGYYFLLQKKQKKQKRKDSELNTLCAFGPYRSPYEASFIRTSARALGLLDAENVS